MNRKLALICITRFDATAINIIGSGLSEVTRLTRQPCAAKAADSQLWEVA